jgi:glycerophosphoryl diester phosphodiesterase
VARRSYLEHPGPTAFAHRGGGKLWPENTLVAFQGALEQGYRYIETDIHVTADGELVVFHDSHLDRTTDGHGLVKDHSLAELQRFDAGFHFTADGREFPHRGTGVRVPTLEELLALHPELRVNIEMKPEDPAVVRRVWEFIEHHRIHDRVLIAAERTEAVRAFRRMSKGAVATSAGRREVATFWAAARVGAARLLQPPFDALQVPVRERVEVVTPRFLAAAKRHAIHVHVWTIDDPDEMRRLLDLGVDGLMSDRPDVLSEVMSAHSPP